MRETSALWAWSLSAHRGRLIQRLANGMIQAIGVTFWVPGNPFEPLHGRFRASGRVMQKGWRRGAHVPWQALGHGCKGLPPQPMMFAKEEPLDDHHHYRL